MIRTIHISNRGDDTNGAGRDICPYATIERALVDAQDGDTLVSRTVTEDRYMIRCLPCGCKAIVCMDESGILGTMTIVISCEERDRLLCELGEIAHSTASSLDLYKEQRDDISELLDKITKHEGEHIS